MFDKWNDEDEKDALRPTPRADRVVLEDPGNEGVQKQKSNGGTCARSHWFSFPALFFLVLLILMVVLSAVLFTLKDSKSSPSALNEAPVVFVAPHEASDDQVELDLPDYSVAAIQSSPASPQARAYRWILNDPLLHKYGPDRLLQRFALATFYYATNGDDWNTTTSSYFYQENEEDADSYVSTQDWMSYSVSECSWLSSTHSLVAELCSKDNGGNLALQDQISTGGGGIQTKRHHRRRHRPRNNRGSKGKGKGKGGYYSRSGSKGGWSGKGKGTRMRRWHQQGWRGRRVLQEAGEEEDLGGEDAIIDANEEQEGSDAWEPVRYLHLTGNNLIGEIPPELALLTHVKSIDLSYNTLFGAIPTHLFGSMRQLSNLNLSFNFISGTVPTEIGLWGGSRVDDFYDAFGKGISPSLPQSLELEANDLIMSLPSELSNLVSLQTLNLADNELTGSMFGSLGALTNLRKLLLQGNRLTGAIPTTIGFLTSLKRLELSSNKVTGTLPTQLADLQALDWLILDQNDIEGSVPSEIGALSNLPVVVLSSNKLTGRLPSELGLMTSLWQLWIYENALTGRIPSELGNLVENGELELLTAYANVLTGFIPKSLCSMEVIEFDCAPEVQDRSLCGCDCHCDAHSNETQAVTALAELNATLAVPVP